MLAQQSLFSDLKENSKVTKSGPVKSKLESLLQKNLSNNLKIASLQICILSPRENDYNLLIFANEKNCITVTKNSGPSVA